MKRPADTRKVLMASTRSPRSGYPRAAVLPRDGQDWNISDLDMPQRLGIQNV
jgi:hypothetical protein